MARSVNMEDVKRGDTQRPFPEDVIFNWEENGRAFEADPARVNWMAGSLEEHGQLQPVVYSITHDKKLKLEAGFYRLLGMLQVNKARPADKRMRLEGTVKDGNAEELFLKNLAENRDRNRTTVVDDAHNVRRLSEQYGKTDEEICLIYAEEIDPATKQRKPMSAGWLENMRKILRLPKDKQQAIQRKELSASIGYMLADMDPAQHDAVLEDAKTEGNGKVTTTSVLKAARKRKALSTSPALKSPEVKAAWTYLKEQDKNPNVQKLADAALRWHAGVLAEPDFFTAIHKLVK